MKNLGIVNYNDINYPERASTRYPVLHLLTDDINHLYIWYNPKSENFVLTDRMGWAKTTYPYFAKRVSSFHCDSNEYCSYKYHYNEIVIAIDRLLYDANIKSPDADAALEDIDTFVRKTLIGFYNNDQKRLEKIMCDAK